MNVELHLPDLPEVPVSLGAERGAPRHVRVAWSQRLRGLFGTYLPLLVLAMLAVATWWLVKNSPGPVEPRSATTPTHEPDYTLQHFTLQRYDVAGQLTVQIEGEQLRHYPDTDEIEIDTVHMLSSTPDGRASRATARRAIAAGDNSQVRLEGGAHVTSTDANGATVEIDGEHLLALIKKRQVQSDRPVQVRQAGSVFTADSMEYDEVSRLLTLHGKVKATLLPQGAKR
ncbi:MAG TPA: LPS export ABC transporter periplasmic protein LptC [Ideonella sp.]|nr:LPS export ABC transporter periplasmic protein LptC [Ideonella sp.]